MSVLKIFFLDITSTHIVNHNDKLISHIHLRRLVDAIAKNQKSLTFHISLFLLLLLLATLVFSVHTFREYKLGRRRDLARISMAEENRKETK